GSHAHLYLVGVAVDDRDLLERHAEALRDELREGGFVALAVAVRAGQHLDRADCVDSHLGRLPQADAGPERAYRGRRGDAAGLDVAAHADAAQLSAPLRFLAAGGEAGVVGRLRRRL